MRDLRDLEKIIDQFEDPLVGFAILFVGIDPEYAKSIGIH
jgi:hypothetical protein